ncbi:S41 family peptidase [Acetobacter sp. P5B1]|uniref:S41 family peptidase n=1 Tax=Acetobacter sp. P5B1 TaxID=2762620 RepID=UPI001C04D0FB|nr:S41 family peptidase [Acetobacter sp. P5B1]
MAKRAFLVCAGVFVMISAKGFAEPVQWDLFDPQHQFTLSEGAPCPDGEKAVVLHSATASPKQFAVTRTVLSTDGLQNKVLRLRAQLSVQDVQAGAGLWMMLYDGTKQIGVRNTQKDMVRGQSVTRMQEMVVWVPPQATRVVYGVMLRGPGTVTACGLHVGPVVPAGEQNANQSVAVQTMAFAINAMRTQALHASLIDWESRTPPLLELARVGSADDLYAEIRTLLADLHDGHSFVMPPDTVRKLAAQPEQMPVFTKISSDVGKISLPALTSHSAKRMQDFSRTGQQIFAQAPDMRGWIVDLRHDRGGNMWPMLQALRPLLGNGDLGFFEDRTGKRSAPWRAVAQGVAPQDGGPDLSRVPVAVLIGPQTASAGEAVAIALKGRPNTRFFGTATHGQTSGNKSFTLPDGGRLVVAAEFELDRTGKRYEGPVQPDVVEADPDAAERAAEVWLRQG